MIMSHAQPSLTRTGTGNDRRAPESPIRAPHTHPAFAREDVSNQVTVIGAGPAGLVCAIALARAGRRVLVREWHRNVGMRFHGDFQGLENWSGETDVLDDLRAAGIEPTFDHHGVTRGTVYDSRGSHYQVQSARALFYLVRRGSDEGCLDHALLRHAIAAGVEVRFEDRASDAEGNAVLAIGPRRADIIAVGYVFETHMADGSWLVLDERLAPRGYAYLLIHAGRGTLASCMLKGFKQQAVYLERTVAFLRSQLGLTMRAAKPFGGFGNFRIPRSAIQGGHPVIGEQAGFQDALAGFGMRYAIRSGLLAARSILEARDYSSLWREELRPLLRAGMVNRFIVNLIGERGWPAVEKLLTHGDARIALQRMYRPSIASRILFPIAQLHHLGTSRDPSCDHIDCDCVWCQHQAEHKPPIADRNSRGGSTPTGSTRADRGEHL